MERVKTDGRVVRAGREALERISTLSGVVVGITSVRCWCNSESFRGRAKRKPDERERDEHQTAPQRRPVNRRPSRWDYSRKESRTIHRKLLSVLPVRYSFELQTGKGEELPGGKDLCPIQIVFKTGDFVRGTGRVSSRKPGLTNAMN